MEDGEGDPLPKSERYPFFAFFHLEDQDGGRLKSSVDAWSSVDVDGEPFWSSVGVWMKSAWVSGPLARPNGRTRLFGEVLLLGDIRPDPDMYPTGLDTSMTR